MTQQAAPMSHTEQERYESNPPFVLEAIKMVAATRNQAKSVGTMRAWEMAQLAVVQIGRDMRKEGCVGTRDEPIYLHRVMLDAPGDLLMQLDHVHDLQDRCTKTRWPCASHIPDLTNPAAVERWLAL